MGERFALPLLRSVLPCLQMRHLPEPSEWVRWRFKRLGNTFYKLTFSGSCIKDGLGAVICQVHARIKADWRLCSMMIELIRKYCEGYSSSTGLTISFCCKAWLGFSTLPLYCHSILFQYSFHTICTQDFSGRWSQNVTHLHFELGKSSIILPYAFHDDQIDSWYMILMI